jgi:hypothetical protein
MKRFVRALAFFLIPAIPAAAAAPILPEDYRGWERTTTAVLDYRIPGHQEGFRIPYINAVGTGVKTEIKGGRVTWTYPTGTIILKEMFKAGGPPAKNEKPLRLYGMVKDPKNTRAKGGWVWIIRDPATGRETVYESPLCIDCHSYANDKHTYGDKNPRAEFRDFVFFPYVGQGKAR